MTDLKEINMIAKLYNEKDELLKRLDELDDLIELEESKPLNLRMAAYIHDMTYTGSDPEDGMFYYNELEQSNPVREQYLTLADELISEGYNMNSLKEVFDLYKRFNKINLS